MADRRPSSRDRAPGKLIGLMNCWSCKREIPVKRKEGGKLSMPCSYCDFPHYANRGTEHEANVMKDVRLIETPAPAPDAQLAGDPPADPKPPESPPAPVEKPAARRPLFGGR